MEGVMKYTYYSTEDFIKQLKNHNSRIRKNILECLNDFALTKELNKDKNGLNYEKLEGNNSYYSIRVDRNYRVILYRNKKASSFVFLWTDKHDEAYKWADNHFFKYDEESLTEFELKKLKNQKIKIDDEEIYTDVNKFYKYEYVVKKQQNGLFEGLDADSLLNFGINKDLIESVLLITTHNEFYKLKSIISEPAYWFLRNYLVNVNRSIKHISA